MKQFEIIQERLLGGNRFYVRPFGAFKSANMSGEIIGLLTPMLAAFAALIDGARASETEVRMLDLDAEKAAPHLARALEGLSGDRLEALLKKLLVQHKNISVQLAGKNDAEPLTEDLANEIFCGETQDIFILAFDVIKANYAGFFKKLGGQYGEALDALLAKV
jgi:hypothetical protein